MRAASFWLRATSFWTLIYDIDKAVLKCYHWQHFKTALSLRLEAYRRKVTANTSAHLFVYSEYRMLKIELKEVEYIESLEDYIKIYLLNAKPVMALMTLKGVLEKLPPEQFKRIHRSYIVAVDKVRSIQNRKLQLLSGTELPVSESYAEFVRDWFKR